LPVSQQLLCLQIVCRLAVIHLQIRSNPVREFLHPAGNKDEKNQAAVLGEIVEKVSAHLPWHPRCLEQALCCCALLSARNIAYEISYGTRKINEGLEAHAWVTVDDTVICGASVIAEYQEIARLDSLDLTASDNIFNASHQRWR